MSLFTNNWATVVKKCPELLTDPRVPSVAEGAAYPGLNFFTARGGALTAKLNESVIHSSFDPVREAEKIINTECKPEISVCIFYGCGLGYYIGAFVDRFPHTPVLIVEPDLDLLLAVLNQVDLSPLLAQEQVFLYVKDDPEELGSLLQQLPLNNVKMITLRSLYTKDERYYRKADRVIQSVLARKEINFNTIKRFGKLWVRNLFKNMSVSAHAPGLAALENHFKGLPALVLASGPTLDLLLPSLPTLQERFLLICVDTSLRACLERGVAPDFVIVVDPQYWNTRHLDGLAEQPAKLALLKAKTFLLAESSTHPAVFKKLPIPVFLCSSYFPLGQYFEQLTGLKGKLGAGGSVATTAWDLARFLGTSPIYMSGLDLGYPNLATHFKGAFFENAFHGFSSRLQPASALTFAYVMQADPFPTTANGPTPVLTDIRMQVYRSWFQTQLKNQQVATYNLSPTGVKIEGMPYQSLAALTACPIIRPQLDGLLEQVRTNYENQTISPDELQGEQILVQALSTLEQDFTTLAALAGEGLVESQKLSVLAAGDRKFATALAKLNQLDQQIMQLGARQIAGFLLQPLIHETLQMRQGAAIPGQNTTPGTEPDLKQIMEISKQFYQELSKAAQYHLELISQSLAQIKMQQTPNAT